MSSMDPEYSIEERQVRALEDIAESLNSIAHELEWRDSSLAIAAPDLLEAARSKLRACEECKDAALMSGEFCSDECAALATAIEKAEGVADERTTRPDLPAQPEVKPKKES